MVVSAKELALLLNSPVVFHVPSEEAVVFEAYYQHVLSNSDLSDVFEHDLCAFVNNPGLPHLMSHLPSWLSERALPPDKVAVLLINIQWIISAMLPSLDWHILVRNSRDIFAAFGLFNHHVRSIIYSALACLSSNWIRITWGLRYSSLFRVCVSLWPMRLCLPTHSLGNVPTERKAASDKVEMLFKKSVSDLWSPGHFEALQSLLEADSSLRTLAAIGRFINAITLKFETARASTLNRWAADGSRSLLRLLWNGVKPAHSGLVQLNGAFHKFVGWAAY